MADVIKEFTPVFTFSNKHIPDFYKQLFIGSFVEARNEAIKELNPNYEKWNAEYDDAHKHEEGHDYEYDKEYNAFIRAKQKDILDNYNKTHSHVVKLDSDEWCDIFGKWNFYGKEETIHLSLIPR